MKTDHVGIVRAVRVVLVSVFTLVAAGVMLTFGAGPAKAHSVLESSSPEQGAEVDLAPSAVVLAFSEEVSIDEAAIRVINADGRRFDDGRAIHPAGNERNVQVGMASQLPRGSYTVVWRVISADSHPVAGTFSFGYGVPAGQATATAPHGSQLVGFLRGGAGFMGNLGFSMVLGVGVFAGWISRESWQRRRSRVLFGAGLATFGLGALASFLLTGPYDASTALGSLLSGNELDRTFDTRHGQLLLLRIGLVVLAVTLWATARHPSPADARVLRLAASVLAIVGALTFSLAGHAGVGRQHLLASAGDTVHVLAASIWIGGLIVLLALLVARSDVHGESQTLGEQTLPRWSMTAFWCVAALVVTGTYQSWREIGTWAAFPDTTYGRLVLVKIVLLIALVGLGWFGRRWIRHMSSSSAEGGTAAPSRRMLGRSVGMEVAMSVAVLAVVAVLVDVQPGRDSFNPPFEKTLVAQGVSPVDQLSAVVHITSTRPGVALVSVVVRDRGGGPRPFMAISGSLSEPDKELGPVRFTIPASTAGQGRDVAIVVPQSGRWVLDLQIRTTDTASFAASTSYSVR